VFLFGNYKISEFAQIFQSSRREEVKLELRQVARSQVQVKFAKKKKKKFFSKLRIWDNNSALNWADQERRNFGPEDEKQAKKHTLSKVSFHSEKEVRFCFGFGCKFWILFPNSAKFVQVLFVSSLEGNSPALELRKRSGRSSKKFGKCLKKFGKKCREGELLPRGKCARVFHPKLWFGEFAC